MIRLSLNGLLAVLSKLLILPTQVSRVCKHFQKSVKLENIICSSNTQPGSLMRNHKNGQECVSLRK